MDNALVYKYQINFQLATSLVALAILRQIAIPALRKALLGNYGMISVFVRWGSLAKNLKTSARINAMMDISG